jgi:solute carrier family 25 (mitochondrial carnitine/acylcarnitine transporter), member 20/29
MRKIWAEKGLSGLYKGQVATLWREGPGYASYFLTYELLMQREMAQKGVRRDEIAASHTILYGAIAGYAVCPSIYFKTGVDHIWTVMVHHLPCGRDQVPDAN